VLEAGQGWVSFFNPQLRLTHRLNVALHPSLEAAKYRTAPARSVTVDASAAVEGSMGAGARPASSGAPSQGPGLGGRRASTLAGASGLPGRRGSTLAAALARPPPTDPRCVRSRSAVKARAADIVLAWSKPAPAAADGGSLTSSGGASGGGGGMGGRATSTTQLLMQAAAQKAAPVLARRRAAREHGRRLEHAVK
jgi:hypothetical protein